MKFCGDFVKTERMKIKRFYGILKAEFREFITPSKCETLDELINLARDREIEIKRQEERGEKRSSEKGASSSPSKKGKYQEQGRKDKSKGGITPCKTCGKLHTGECLLGKKGCYKCGNEGHSSYQCPNNPKTCFNCFERGHIKSECPKLQQESKKEDKKQEGSRAKGRMFQITSEEAKVHPNVVSGIFLLNSMPVYVLFDTGATMSFISREIAHHPSFKIKLMSVPLEVEIADSKNYLLYEICRSCKFTIEDEEFDIDLIPIDLGEFKMIVGMDWKARYHAEINCETKTIHVQSPSGKRLNIQGERKVEAKLYTLVQAVKYTLNGSRAYLAYMVDAQQGFPKLEDVEIVNEFLDVFPEELPGLTPDREVEFRIELNLGAKPVAKAPYRLAPTEMRELMTQLQDLFYKGFIRPSYPGENTKTIIERYRHLVRSISKIGITKRPEEWVEKFVSALPQEEWENYILNLKISGEFSQLTICPLIEKIEEQVVINVENKKSQNDDQRGKEQIEMKDDDKQILGLKKTCEMLKSENVKLLSD
ncbi:uncharacterized protein LOC110914174 [Helianthus annuus]|uniref:uncharacterized protein LOC110914174 n=1 Tax=Helianthus annuus TaxID=4232 RepID=UPI000B903B34|nr:uncharacterized protein LOC110914174 [Helianthus annuus]